MDEYIIVNKTAIQKEMEELKQLTIRHIGYAEQEVYDKIDNLISQSTPLIPEITLALHQQAMYDQKEIDNYISNLKLDV